MAVYQYRNAEGQDREIVAPMKTPPPEELVIFDDGTWMDMSVPVHFEDGDPRYDELKNKTNDQRIFRRVYGAGLEISTPNFVPNANKDGMPVSHAAPRRKGGEVVKRGGQMVREHKDGSLTNMKGQPIITSNNEARETARRTGMEID